MTVKVEFYSLLRDITGCHELEVSLPPGSQVEVLLGGLYAQFPRLAEWDSKILIAADLDYVDRHHPVKPGEVISIMPPVQGG